jgi:hypothetical protein
MAILAGCSSEDAAPADKGAVGTGNAKSVAPPASGSPKNDADAPEDALKAFLHAMLKGDKAAAEKYLIPHPDAALIWAVAAQFQGVPEEQRAIMTEELDRRLEKVQRLKAGDSFPFGDGTRTIKPEEINENRVWILEPVSSDVYILIRSEGIWKIDMSIVIENNKQKMKLALPPDNELP